MICTFKYEPDNIEIPHDKRAEINEKILHLIKENDTGIISKEMMYLCYTGLGGLHGLKLSDYDNYTRYSEAKKPLEKGQFWTPDAVCRQIYDMLEVESDALIADMACGAGAFINSCPVEENFYGCEIDEDAWKVASFLFPKAHIDLNDIQYYRNPFRFNYVVGNPPYNLTIGWQNSQLYYIDKSADVLDEGGVLAVVMPESFLNDEFQDKSKIEYIDSDYNFIGQYRLPDDTFKANIRTKVMVFQLKSKVLDDTPYTVTYSTYEEVKAKVKAVKKIMRTAKFKLVQRSGKGSPSDYSIKNPAYNIMRHGEPKKSWDPGRVIGFEFKVKKLLFDIERNTLQKDKYEKCLNYIRKHKNQVIPCFSTAAARTEFFENEYISQEMVIDYLKYSLRPESKKKTRRQHHNSRTLRRKEIIYDRQQIPFSEMGIEPEIENFIKSLSFRDKKNKLIESLTELQSEDVNKIAQKRYAYLQWQMGCGKTFAALALSKYRHEYQNITNTIIIGPAIAITGTWELVMKNNKYSFVTLKRARDVRKIKPGDYVLMSINRMNKDSLRKALKRWITEATGNRVQLIFDEADNISKLSTKRFRYTYELFRDAKYKLLKSGTMTRNNINEAYPQLYFLYGSSMNLPSMNPYVYKRGKYGEILEETNIYQGRPFPPYKEGYRHFEKSFNPFKATVFGRPKNTQEVYNREHLKKIIDYTVITRKFEEVAGKDKYTIKQITCGFNNNEVVLYNTIMKEFQSLVHQYFMDTGCGRKEAGLRIVRQIILLLRACAAPNLFHHYPGSPEDTCSKLRRVINILRFNRRYVAIGCTHKDVVNEYYRVINENYPNRPVFKVTGDDSFENRLKIIDFMEKNPGAIIISTQQSLSCSMDIEFVDTVIITELNWNDAQMSQYYFRFIRFSSKSPTTVYFLTYKNSMETNLLRLILDKEKLNMFMKDTRIDEERLMGKYGIKDGLLDELITKTKNEEGGLVINWTGQEYIPERPYGELPAKLPEFGEQLSFNLG